MYPLRPHLFIIIILTCIGCASKKREIAGNYSLMYFPKATIEIKNDQTFEFVLMYANPYLHPGDRPDNDFVKTAGTLQKIDKQTYYLNSIADTLIYPLAEVKKSAAKVDSVSNFTFYDTYGDSVNIEYVKLSDSSIVMLLHRRLLDFSENLVKRDTIEFHFFGYRPFTFVSGERKNYDYKITLKPIFRPGFLDRVKLRVKGKRLYIGNNKKKAIYKRTHI